MLAGLRHECGGELEPRWCCPGVRIPGRRRADSPRITRCRRTRIPREMHTKRYVPARACTVGIGSEAHRVRVAYDCRPVSDLDGIGRYARCLRSALKETTPDGDELLETRRPSATLRSRGADVLHAPWMHGAMLHSPCPMVVTVHDLSALKRRSEHLRGGLRQRMR